MEPLPQIDHICGVGWASWCPGMSLPSVSGLSSVNFVLAHFGRAVSNMHHLLLDVTSSLAP